MASVTSGTPVVHLPNKVEIRKLQTTPSSFPRLITTPLVAPSTTSSTPLPSLVLSLNEGFQLLSSNNPQQPIDFNEKMINLLLLSGFSLLSIPSLLWKDCYNWKKVAFIKRGDKWVPLLCTTNPMTDGLTILVSYQAEVGKIYQGKQPPESTPLVHSLASSGREFCSTPITSSQLQTMIPLSIRRRLRKTDSENTCYSPSSFLEFSSVHLRRHGIAPKDLNIHFDSKIQVEVDPELVLARGQFLKDLEVAAEIEKIEKEKQVKASSDYATKQQTIHLGPAIDSILAALTEAKANNGNTSQHLHELRGMVEALSNQFHHLVQLLIPVQKPSKDMAPLASERSGGEDSSLHRKLSPSNPSLTLERHNIKLPELIVDNLEKANGETEASMKPQVELQTIEVKEAEQEGRNDEEGFLMLVELAEKAWRAKEKKRTRRQKKNQNRKKNKGLSKKKGKKKNSNH